MKSGRFFFSFFFFFLSFFPPFFSFFTFNQFYVFPSSFSLSFLLSFLCSFFFFFFFCLCLLFLGILYIFNGIIYKTFCLLNVFLFVMQFFISTRCDVPQLDSISYGVPLEVTGITQPGKKQGKAVIEPRSPVFEVDALPLSHRGGSL